jgi:hypothetical protein
MMATVQSLLLLNCWAAASFAPAVWYRFEDATNVTVDSSGNDNNLLVGKPGTERTVPEPMTKGPVGGFLSFGSDAVSPGQYKHATSWGAYPTQTLAASPGITLEFLMKANPGFLRGGTATPFSDDSGR